MKVTHIVLEDKIEKLLRQAHYDEIPLPQKEAEEQFMSQSPEVNTVLSGDELKKSNYDNKDSVKLKEEDIADVSDPTPIKVRNLD